MSKLFDTMRMRRCIMKKFIMILLLLSTILLSACAAAQDEEPFEENIELTGYIRFKIEDMTFSNTSEYDVTYGVGSSYQDFTIFVDSINNVSLTTAELGAFEALFTIMDQLINSYRSYKDIVAYSSQDFADACESKSITITASTIFTFNTFKSFYSEIENETYYIQRIDYLEIYLDRTLTSDEKFGLELIQSTQNAIYYDSSAINLDTISYADLLVQINDVQSEALSATQEAQLQEAYNVIQLLLE